MSCTTILTNICGILRLQDDLENPVTILSDYGDFTVPRDEASALANQVNGKQVIFDVYDQNKETPHVTNIKPMESEEALCASAANYRQPQTSPDSVASGCHDKDITNDVPDELTCSICCGVLRDPVITKCEHLFCRKCISKWLATHCDCPLDRQPVDRRDLTDAPRFLKSMLDRQKVHCDFQEDGCQEIVRLDHLEAHMQTCRFKDISLVPKSRIPLSIEESPSSLHIRRSSHPDIDDLLTMIYSRRRVSADRDLFDRSEDIDLAVGRFRYIETPDSIADIYNVPPLPPDLDFHDFEDNPLPHVNFWDIPPHPMHIVGYDISGTSGRRRDPEILEFDDPLENTSISRHDKSKKKKRRIKKSSRNCNIL